MMLGERHRMASGEQEVDISDRDVWDDSTLIKHWDASLAEYKKYHSLDAQGASVAEQPDVEMEEQEKQHRQAEVEEQEYDDYQAQELHTSDEEELAKKEEAEALAKNEAKDGDLYDVREETSTQRPGPAISLDDLDDGVKQLAMAWYWAGYYHGLEVGRNRRS
ncbi:hypothetical protein TRICI_003186 [Trichomonascus ciferrii]|uniref:Survival Motor Neuron Gemin2-binding domain-containing protein n=1 Tax=Trichomonascus ciferrii TaxID=44093 RepID=A0A642V9P4_9ASCO|nr:hypothetical protein TRICI_003186 [Trichomonascus ciferrii]